MPAIFLLSCFAICAVTSAVSTQREKRIQNTTTHADTSELLTQMVGKSQSECRKLARWYR